MRKHAIEDIFLADSQPPETGDHPEESGGTNNRETPSFPDLEPLKLQRREDAPFPFSAHLDDEDDEHIFIECPGATLYEAGTDNIISGVEFADDDDPTAGYRVINKQVFPPTHTRWRRIKKEALGNIRRCQACQDYTVRYRRKEGADFYIPSVKHPKRKKLKSIPHGFAENHDKDAP